MFETVTKSETENALPRSHSRFSPALVPHRSILVVLLTVALTFALIFTLTTATFASSRYDGPAELPRVTVRSAMANTPALGSLITVNAGGDLQSALNNAQCGDVIQLQAGATFTGLFTVPAKNCDNSHWIVIRTSAPDSALPAEGARNITVPTRRT